MSRTCLALAACAAWAGCQGPPVGPQLPPSPPHPYALRLFGADVAPEPEAVRQAVVARVPLFTPLDEAQKVLQDGGFDCGHFSAWADALPALPPRPDGARGGGPLYAHTYARVQQWWGQEVYAVLVVLVPNEYGAVTEVTAWVGVDRPSVAEARKLMEGAGFRCRRVEGDAEKDIRPHLLCEATVERLLDADTVRVKLYEDASGALHNAEVECLGGWWAARDLLPGPRDSPAGFARKTLLLPLRVGNGCAAAAGQTVAALLFVLMVCG